MAESESGYLLKNQTTTGVGVSKKPTGIDRTYLASAIADSGAGGSASVLIEVSNDEISWLTMCTITFTGIGDTAESDGFTSSAAWRYLRGNVVAISGAGMTVSLSYGVNG